MSDSETKSDAPKWPQLDAPNGNAQGIETFPKKRKPKPKRKPIPIYDENGNIRGNIR